MRIAFIITIGLLLVYFVGVLVPERMIFRNSIVQRDEMVYCFPEPSRLPKIILWWEAPPEVKGEYRASKCVRIIIDGPTVLVNELVIPVRDLTTYINKQLEEQHLENVVVFTRRSSTFQDVITTLDACRKTHVKMILLNQYELPQ